MSRNVAARAHGATADAAEAATRTLVQALRDPARYGHPAARVEPIETHISYVLLAGEYAYKIKKPVDLGFLDFTTLEARRRYCEEELRLNRRTAPALYLDIVPISGTAIAPQLGGSGEAIEYALRMRAFEQEALLDRIARRGGLGRAQADALALEVARFHAAAERAAPASGFGGATQVLGPALQNFDQIEALPGAAAARTRLEALRTWTLEQHAGLEPAFARRRQEGWVRECHGDLHLGNIALIEERPTLFDALEFNPALRWIDVMNDVAFLAMDLLDHRLDTLAWRFLDGWLGETGDYEGLAVLRYYLVYRAMVRAKVACMRGLAPGTEAPTRSQALGLFDEYLALAERLAGGRRPALVITFGHSGSGKTSVAAELVERLGALRLRSDVERKRAAGLAAGERSGSGLGAGLYTAARTAETYARLRALADSTLAAGFTVVVDAAFPRRADRSAFRELAALRRVPFAIAACEAPEALLRERIVRRGATAADASEATLEVLERQVRETEPLDAAERAAAVPFYTAAGGATLEAACSALEERLNADRPREATAGGTCG